MQTKKIIPVLLSLFTAVAAQAQSPAYQTTINNTRPPEAYNSFQVSISAVKPSTFSLWIQNPEKKKLIVEISHRYYGTVIDTIISGEEFSRRYNMQEAEDGNYTIKVSCGRERFVKEIELNTITTRKVVLK